jgi:hypothetical protein
MKDLPKIYPKEIIEKITNLKTGQEEKVILMLVQTE